MAAVSRYAATLFLSAFLLFSVQPLLGKYSLPWFGGTPSVWTACLLFFQSVLLAGYFYAHLVARRVAPARQPRVHLAMLGVVLVVFAASILPGKAPILPWDGWRPTSTDWPTLKLTGMLLVTAALPLFALSTTAPLLQRWFSFAHPDRSPYRLYAMSNAGSLAALLAYPLLIEPFLSRTLQGIAWSVLFVAFAAAVAGCGRFTARAVESAPPQVATPAAAAPALLTLLPWLGLPALASMLLLATTNQLSQDVAAGPFLWMLPLALYLLTFILCFEREGWYRRWLFFTALALSLLAVAVAKFHGATASLPMQLGAYCAALFCGCMVYHGELYRLRPPPEQLSAFYLWTSLGGVLGSAFVGLLAPHLFQIYLEYPLSLCAAAFLAAAILVRDRAEQRTLWQLVQRPLGALLMLVAAGSVALAVQDRRTAALEHVRGFFGVISVHRRAHTEPGYEKYSLVHGVISHGAQYIDPQRRTTPTTYYTWDSGLARTILLLREQRGGRPLRVAVLGLGVGTVAALLREGDVARFYEINPDVIDYATGKGGYFSFLADTQAKVELVLGDARTSLENELAQRSQAPFDLIMVDVFSGDAVPVHLLTEEAAKVFLAHLAPQGMIAFHITNRHLQLAPVVASHVNALNLHGILVHTEDNGETSATTWAMVAALDVPLPSTAFRAPAMETAPITGKRHKVRWTDEKNTLLSVLGK